jgi:phenylacetate-CoA ligase
MASAKQKSRRKIATMFEPEIERLPQSQLRALQLKRLQGTLRHAYRNVPHFRAAFDRAGLKPGDLKSLNDIVRFPFTVKADLRDNYPFGMLAVPQEKVLRVHASSGTTDKPTVVGYTKRDIKTWSSLMARSIVAAGGRPGDVVHNANGYGLFTGGLGFHDGASALGCTVVPVSGGNTERQVMLLNDFKADILIATPSYALNIADVAEARGVDLKGGPLRVSICGGESASAALRREASRRLGAAMIDHYGLSEIMGPGVAAECIESNQDADEAGGLHLWEDHFYCEIVDPESDERLPDGEIGELVISTLTKEALPMVRYRTGDLTRIIAEPCICGRTHRRMARTTGRTDDMLVIRGVNLYPSALEETLLGQPGVAPHYLLIVRPGRTMATLDVEVEADAKIKKSAYDGLAGKIGRRIKTANGVSCKVIIRAPGKLPRSEGKAVRVRDLRKAK